MSSNHAQQVMEMLTQRGLLSESQRLSIETEARASGHDVLDTLLEKNVVSEEEITKTKAQVWGFPYINVLEKEIPAEVLHIVPRLIAEQYRVVPVARTDRLLTAAIVDPFSLKAVEAIDFIVRHANLRVQYIVASQSSIQSVLRQYASLHGEVAQELERHSDVVADLDKAPRAQEIAEERVDVAPVTKIVDVILRYAVEGHASDIHIEPIANESRVRYRVDGVLHTSLRIPRQVHTSVVARIKVLANLKLDETRLPQDGRFRMLIEGRDVDFRVAIMPLINAEKVELRILDKDSGIHALEDLGFEGRQLEMLRTHLKQPHGMILLTGPTGAGKSTTLYAMLLLLDREKRNIVTLEDPVEYYIPGISQSQVNPDIGLTFSRGLRSLVRQDPDIMMVGEIRDNETAELAIHAALTGHMVLSTLHTNDAVGAIPRLIDMNIEPFLIASALRLVAAQRLVRRICSFCQQSETLPTSAEQRVLEELRTLPAQALPTDVSLRPPLMMKRGTGCEHCERTGYRGRIAIAEVLELTEHLQQIIANQQYNNFERMSEELQTQGMMTLKQDGIVKALRGLTTLEEVWAATEQ